MDQAIFHFLTAIACLNDFLIGKLYLFTKLFYSLFFLQLTYKQLSMLFGYNVAIQALNNNLALICSMNHTVLAFIQSDAFAYLGIAILILRKQGTEAAPAT